ncbi:penicillin-binding protein 2 [Desulfohalotomaculum tongense]|uniref:penicillin-binding protein 2 n=1 Tax=Desulforadius tongensis TaxID=1216062 RepID=UPI001959EF47|nr:penicillin-binding protein 2 [Desulforadius tongensis]MBM7854528.1 penicillin-binding protein 2 [Desulforadius tongensis]
MERKVVKKKARVLAVMVVLVFAVLVGRLAYLQFFQAEKYTTLARQNHMRLIPIPAPRGEMYARDGKTKIVGNKPVYTVSLVYLGLKNTPQVAQRLAEILSIDADEIMQKLDAQKLRLYQPVKIAANVPLETVLEIEQHRLELPGVVIDIEPVRDYPLGGIAAHVVGYVRQISEQELEERKDKGYRPGDEIGKLGLERKYEDYLRGTAGARQVEVDAQGRPVRDLGISKPVPGNGLILTIDHKVQKAADEALARQIKYLQENTKHKDAKAGAVVAVDVHSGEILALASYPTYDPRVFTKFLPEETWRELVEKQAFTNRALSAYPPGSTFKMVVGIAGLETGIIDPDKKMFDPGYFMAGTRINDWKPGGHGYVDLRKAIQISCNTYFGTYALEIGIDKIAEYAGQFGLGSVLGIDLYPGEEEGILPTPESKYQLWKQNLSSEQRKQLEEIEAKYKELIENAAGEKERQRLRRQLRRERQRINWNLVWYDYDTGNTSLGQGDSKYTPLQLACYTAAIANGGTLYKPHLVKEIIDHRHRTVKKFSPEVIRKIDVAPENLAVIREGMKLVAQPGGTAYYQMKDLPVAVGAKTGTAEVFGEDNHALIVAFAPADDPQIAVAAIIQHGGHGGTGAGPVVHDVLAAYFGGELVDGKWVFPSE